MVKLAGHVPQVPGSMNVSLTPELERFVEERVRSGQYASASEVVRAALRLLDRHDREYEARLEALRREVRLGVEEDDRGEVIPGDVAFAQAREELRRRIAG